MNEGRNIQPVLNALFVFEQAAKLESFTAAAKQLGMAQPSVSRFVSNLEDHLGVTLFDRRQNRVMLTQAGEELLNAAQLGFGHIRTVIDQVAQPAAPRSVTIACTHGFAHMWVLPRLEALQARLPGCELRITASEGPSRSEAGPLDLEIRFGDGRWGDAVSHLLFKEETFPVCAPGFLERHGLKANEVTAQDLTKLPLLHQDRGENDWLDWSSWFARLGQDYANPAAAHFVPSYQFLLQAAMEGRGVALAWEGLIEPYRRNGWLVALPGLRVRTKTGYYLTHAPNHPFAAQVADWIAATA